jgi:flagellar hook-length control protein FliK
MEAVAPRTTPAPTSALTADMLALAATRGDQDDATRKVSAEAMQLPDGSPLPSDVAAPRTPAIPSVVIESPAFSATWRAEVAQEIAQFVMLRHDRAELHITPPHLGPISVQVTMDAGQANLLVTAPQPATRDALELALPQLRDSLAQQGITLGQASVQDDRPRPFSAPADRHGGSGSAASGDAEVRAGSATPAVVARVRGLIDLFA